MKKKILELAAKLRTKQKTFQSFSDQNLDDAAEHNQTIATFCGMLAARLEEIAQGK